MAKVEKSPLVLELQALQGSLERLVTASVDSNLSAAERKAAHNGIEQISKSLDNLLVKIDPIKRPTRMFDPSDPATAGRIVALTLARISHEGIKESG